MLQQQNQEQSLHSSPRQSQSSCESSTERMNRAQTNHSQFNPYADQQSYKTNNFFIQDYTIEGEDLGNRGKNQQLDRQLKTAVSQLVENDDIDQVELGESSVLKKSSNAPPPAPNPSQTDGKRQFRDITSFFKNNNIFLDEEINIKCTTSQILSKKDEFDECLIMNQPQNFHQQSYQQLHRQSNEKEQSSPPIGRNKEKKGSPIKGGDNFGRQIMSEYICQEKEISIQQSNLHQPTIQANQATNNTAGGGFQQTNSIYSLGCSEHSSVQTQQNKIAQTLKPNPTNDSLNSFNSVQLSSVENSKGSSNQSIKVRQK